MARLSIAGRFAGTMALATLLLTPVIGSAQTNVFDDSVSTSTITNASTLRIPGTVLSFGTGSAGNWNINVFAAPNECLRLDVISQAADLEMVVVAPNGLVFRNDDRALLDRRPLVKITPTPNNGWYTVHLSTFNGSAVDANFVLLYGRYNSLNPNCFGRTVPFAPAEEEKATADQASPNLSAPPE